MCRLRCRATNGRDGVAYRGPRLSYGCRVVCVGTSGRDQDPPLNHPPAASLRLLFHHCHTFTFTFTFTVAVAYAIVTLPARRPWCIAHALQQARIVLLSWCADMVMRGVGRQHVVRCRGFTRNSRGRRADGGIRVCRLGRRLARLPRPTAAEQLRKQRHDVRRCTRLLQVAQEEVSKGNTSRGAGALICRFASDCGTSACDD
jgi:hypothetical protein